MSWYEYNNGLRPSHRIRRVLFRISRKRWVSAIESEDIIRRMSKKICALPHQMSNAINILPVGIIGGLPPISIGSPYYREAVLKLKNVDSGKLSQNDMRFELFILKTQIKNLKAVGWT